MLSFLGLLLFSFVTLRSVIETEAFDCSADEDCTVNCVNSTCTNQKINCPTSSDSKTYTCTVRCLDVYSCANTSVTATSDISTFVFEALHESVSNQTEIYVYGASNVQVVCKGSNSCVFLTLSVQSAGSVTLTVDNADFDKSTFAMVSGKINISHTKDVYVACNGTRACFLLEWHLYANTNMSLLCNGQYACFWNYIWLNQSSQATFQGMAGLPSVAESMISIENVASLTVRGTESAIQANSFYLVNVARFLLDIAGSGNTAGTTWQRTNVSAVAINTWNATSYWITSGMEIADEYTCPNDRDCYIRMDVISTSVGSLQFTCPMASQTQGTTNEVLKCVFYCSANYGCGNVQLLATNTPNVGLFFTGKDAVDFPFQLIANASGLNSTATSLNIRCDSQSSCRSAIFEGSGYENVMIGCTGDLACQWSDFYMYDFGNCTFLPASYGLFQAFALLRSGVAVVVDHDHASVVWGQTFQNSYWLFEQIDSVDVFCSQENDCSNAMFRSSNVSQLAVTCGKKLVSEGHSNCFGATFDVDKNTDFTLQCAGAASCLTSQVYYDADIDTVNRGSCPVSCTVDALYPVDPSCENMTIIVQNNPIGYDYIDLDCQIDQGYQACKNVVVQCSDADATCQCPVLYDASSGGWGCQGTCGTTFCEGDISYPNVSTTVAIIVVVFSLCMWIVTLRIVCYLRAKKRKQDRLLPSSTANKQSTTPDSNAKVKPVSPKDIQYVNNTYQNL